MKSLLNALQDGRLIELPDTDKEKSLKYLAHIIEAIPDLASSPELAEAMIAREQSQNTGIGLGIACPHVRAAGAGELLCAVGWSPSGINYGAIDGKPVYLVIMYYIPDSEKSAYLKEISALAGAIHKAGGIQAIAKAEDIATVREELLNWVSNALEATLPEAKARMIQLEARRAAAESAPITSVPGTMQVFPVLTITARDGKPVVLCQNAELVKLLEGDPGLINLLAQRTQFDRGGFRIIFRNETAYPSERTLYDYLAIKLN
jgi:mannitol/fructose-specific phosphotransferase system IIA component (Ntr-type)